MTDEEGAHVVGDWDDIDAAPVDGRSKERVAQIFRDTEWTSVVWIPEWCLDDEDKDIATVENNDRLAVGDVDDYSDKAWRLYQPHREDESNDPGGYLPKSATVHFERLDTLGDLNSPQAGLEDFAL